MGTTIDVSIDESKATEAQEPIAEIGLDAFQEARRDPRVREFLKGARAYGERLKREKRINPTPAR